MHPLMKHLRGEHQNFGKFGFCGARFGQIHLCNILSFDCEIFILLGFVQLIRGMVNGGFERLLLVAG